MVMPAQMTSTVWNQGVKNALICSAGFLLVWSAAVVGTWLVFKQNLFNSFATVLAVLCGLSFLVFLVLWLYEQRTMGQLLLDCGPHPTKKLFLINSVFFLIIGGQLITSSSVLLAISGPVIGILGAAYWIIMGTGRLQVRENGIWQYWGLLRWEKIASYRWADDSTLLVRAKGFLSLCQGAVPVPPEHKQGIDDFLRKRCSTPPAA